MNKHVCYWTGKGQGWPRRGRTAWRSQEKSYFSDKHLFKKHETEACTRQHSKSNTVSTTTSISPRPSRTVPCITWFSRNFNTLKKCFQNSKTLQDCLVSSDFQGISTPGKCVFKTPELSRTVPCFIWFSRNFSTLKMRFQNSRSLMDCSNLVKGCTNDNLKANNK